MNGRAEFPSKTNTVPKKDMVIQMTNIDMQKEALLLLPLRLASAVTRAAALRHGVFNEIRLRVGRPLCITSSGANIPCGVVCTREEVDATLRALCGNSLYSHSETIREGYIAAPGGIRAGVCGRAVVESGSVVSVTDITSICIRIPRRIYGAADELYGLLSSSAFRSGMLIYSRPGVGKTTALRELTSRLAGGENPMRIALVDTRCEIAGGLSEKLTVDILSGYPRSLGIEIALRTLSPEYIICDEIGSRADADAIALASSSGVPLIASAHAASLDELLSSEFMKIPGVAKAFDIFVCLQSCDRRSGRYKTDVAFGLPALEVAVP